MPRQWRPILLAYAAFVLIGVNNGGSGVVLLAQMNGYGVGRATIGITFFVGSAGFLLAGLSAGALIERFGLRIALAVGCAAWVVTGFYLATRPPFAAFVLIQAVAGFGTGVLEAALNVYLAELPNATRRLNHLHAFFGVGALIGPVFAEWIVGLSSWTVFYLIVAVATAPLVAGFLLAYPGPRPVEPPATNGAASSGKPAQQDGGRGGLLSVALRDRGVLLGAAMLAVYVGLEIGVGNWAFGYLVQARDVTRSLAGYSVSGYWLGLTLGRFLISPFAARIRLSTAGMMYACLAGVIAATTMAWLSPTAGLAGAALVLLGFFLGPIFPTTMSIAPRLTDARLVATAIGVINGASVIGGSLLPWLEGAVGQSTGIWTLLPFTLALGVVQFAVWRPIAARIRGSQVSVGSYASVAGA